ncbi:MAG TPA: translation initiation factor IF-2, partial [Clostridiales bacterium]|nr:translation initiation factor IF-2 [Clostridiales bacterium]
MSLAKYNAREVAKDFGVSAKVVTGILAQYTKENVSPTKVLTEGELAIVFEHLTQHNQVESVESIYADVYHEPKKETPAPNKGGEGRQGSAQEGKKPQGSAPKAEQKAGAKPQQQPQTAAPAAGTPRAKKVVDTRKGGQV